MGGIPPKKSSRATLTKNFGQLDSLVLGNISLAQMTFMQLDRILLTVHAIRTGLCFKRSQMITQNPSKAGYMMNVSFFVKQSRWLLHISLCHRVISKETGRFASSFKFLGRSSITFQTETIPISIQNWVKRWAGNRSR